jgi:lysine decarboxylase
MPGHKLGAGIPQELLEGLIRLDVTEIPGTDNLHAPEGAIREAQVLAAKAFGADSTYFLVNGSTCGIHAMILSVCKPGGKLVVARDCHKSVLAGMMLAGVEPVFVKTGYDPAAGIPTSVQPGDIRQTLDENPNAAGVLVTRPNYYGICCDIAEIADIVHSSGKVLMVDEAHGAHLAFHPGLPRTAMAGGADMCVQSAHKTLPALTQGAYLHVKSNRVDEEKLRFFLGLLQTSSPSYILMTFLDIAREIMQKYGEEYLQKLLDARRCFDVMLGGLERIYAVPGPVGTGLAVDPTRLVVNAGKTGQTGFAIDRLLRSEYNIQVEMADLYNLVCIGTIADTATQFNRLYKALQEIDSRFKGSTPLADIDMGAVLLPPRILPLSETSRCRKQMLPLDRCAGRISAGILTPYPPGIPLVCPGEMILQESIELLQRIIAAGGTVNGLGDGMRVSVVE